VDRLADGYAYTRIALGAVALVAPGPVGQGFGIGADNRAAARYLGGRDLVAGIGMVLGRHHGRARGWYEAAAVTDAIDAAVTVVAGARGAIPARRAALIAVLALGSAGLGMLLAQTVDEEADVPADPAEPQVDAAGV
jgi:hypothetical protein